MNNNQNNIGEYCKNLMINHTIILVIMLFVVVYIIINYNIIANGDIFSGNIPNAIIISGIIFLLAYFLIMWDDDNHNTVYYADNNSKIRVDNYEKYENNNIIPNTKPIEIKQQNFLPKYKIINKNQEIINTKNNDLINNLEFNSKYIQNSNNKMLSLPIQNTNINITPINKLSSNHDNNIFISHKNKSKFGIKF